MTNWTDIYNKYYNHMHVLALRYMHNKQLSEDIVQDIFLRLLEKKLSPSFMLHAEKYLKTAVYHMCMSHYRKQSNRQSIDEWYTHQNSHTSTNCTEDQVHYRELQQRFLKSLASLPTKQKEVYVLRHIDGFKQREIAIILGKSVKTIKKQYQISSKVMRGRMSA